MLSALITGTSTGIGLETALLFARRGFRVYAGARNPAASEGLQRAVADGLSLTPIALDVDRDESVRQAVAQVGPVDVLVNNAGIASSAAVELMPMEEIRALFETNVFGAVRMMQAVLPSLRERRAGAIVNVTSIAGRITVPCNGYYAATKSAVATLSETLAMEVRPFGIRVANIEPGVILTPIWGKREPAVPEVSDYGQGLVRTSRLLLAQMEGGTLPDVVAEAIYRAATEDGPLYVPVGDDADVLAVARARATPDEWVSIYAEPDEQRFVDRFTQLCSADILNPPSLNARRKSRVRAVSTPPAVQRFLALVTASWVTASLHTVAVLGIADLLADGPRSAEDLAQATETRPDPLRRLLRALAAHGVFAESADGHFEQTELSGFLREGVLGSLRSFLLMLSGEVISPSWGQMLHSIRTGETAFAKVHGCELFEYMQQDQDFAATFNRAMTESSAGVADEIVASYGFSRFATIVDVGGGQGWLLSAILTATPAARGILFDLPHVIEAARPVVTERGVAHRCELITGSFFESVPAGGNAYIMRWIIHDWNDDDATKILRNVRAVIPPDGSLIVFDRVLPERITAGDIALQFGTLMDLNMLVNVTGLERTEAQFRKLFAAGGFRLASRRTTPSGLGIIEGAPA